MKFKWMKDHLDEFSIKGMAKILDVSLSGYHDFKNRPVSKRDQGNQELLQEIINIVEDSLGTYGSPRVTAELKENDFYVNHKKVESLMRSNDISANKPAVYKVKTTDSSHKFPLSPDLVQRNFDPGELNKIWVSDITYIETTSGFSYLTIFHDLGNREPVGYYLSRTLETDGVLKALDRAVLKRNPAKELIIHSDRGVQYASSDFRRYLKDKGFNQSMSRKGNCYDNAVAESFFHTLKTECIYRLEKIPTHEELERILFDYIEVFYIRKRRHSSLDYLSPMNYARLIA